MLFSFLAMKFEKNSNNWFKFHKSQQKQDTVYKKKNGILLPKLFWPTVRKIVLVIEKNLKFEAEGREFSKFLRSLEQFIQTVKGQNNFW